MAMRKHALLPAKMKRPSKARLAKAAGLLLAFENAGYRITLDPAGRASYSSDAPMSEENCAVMLASIHEIKLVLHEAEICTFLEMEIIRCDA